MVQATRVGHSVILHRAEYKPGLSRPEQVVTKALAVSRRQKARTASVHVMQPSNPLFFVCDDIRTASVSVSADIG